MVQEAGGEGASLSVVLVPKTLCDLGRGLAQQSSWKVGLCSWGGGWSNSTSSLRCKGTEGRRGDQFPLLSPAVAWGHQQLQENQTGISASFWNPPGQTLVVFFLVVLCL